MIKNERQFQFTRVQVDRMLDTLGLLDKAQEHSDVHPLLKKAERDSLESQIQDLHEQLQVYEELKSGVRAVRPIESLEDVPKILVEARIAKGWSQKELADSLNLKQQQIQRYEATDYSSASLSRMMEIAAALDLASVGKAIEQKEVETPSMLVGRLVEVGFDRDFVLRRLLTKEVTQEESEGGDA